MKEAMLSIYNIRKHLFCLILLPEIQPVEAAPATPDFLPPILPREYSFSFEETYEAYYFNTSDLFSSQKTSGTQYWSLAHQAQRAVVSSGIGGISSGLSSQAVNRLTVTNFTDPTWYKGSLVVDLIAKTCNYYQIEGGTAYQGYDFYRNFVLGALANGIPVEQMNVSDWVYDGVSYGPVHIWSGTPPTEIPGRVLTYTVVYPQNSSHLLSYQVNGTEDLPNEVTREAVFVSMRSVNMRFNYAEAAAEDEWPEGFFDVIEACPYSSENSSRESNKSSSSCRVVCFFNMKNVFASILLWYFGEWFYYL